MKKLRHFKKIDMKTGESYFISLSYQDKISKKLKSVGQSVIDGGCVYTDVGEMV